MSRSSEPLLQVWEQEINNHQYLNQENKMDEGVIPEITKPVQM